MERPRASKKKKSYHASSLAPELQRVELNPKQREYSDKIGVNEITLCYGPAGTSKTFTACYTALKLLCDGLISKIILVKPVQESGEKLGYLPGTVMEKLDPYIESYRSNFMKIITKNAYEQLEADGTIEFRPLAYMRGSTFDESFMILDEAQNADFRQLMLFVTRMGRDSKVLLTGDVSQYDIQANKVALPKFTELMDGIRGVGSHIFGTEDIVRNQILIEITDRYEKWKNEHEKK
jgi:phosphate starvation-inducible PhoH-like protein